MDCLHAAAQSTDVALRAADASEEGRRDHRIRKLCISACNRVRAEGSSAKQTCDVPSASGRVVPARPLPGAASQSIQLNSARSYKVPPGMASAAVRGRHRPEAVTQTLRNAIAARRIRVVRVRGHAAVEKTTTARILARGLNARRASRRSLRHITPAWSCRRKRHGGLETTPRPNEVEGRDSSSTVRNRAGDRPQDLHHRRSHRSRRTRSTR